ncbi:hypothetical protein D9M71_430160 [compost metagenome]
MDGFFQERDTEIDVHDFKVVCAGDVPTHLIRLRRSGQKEIAFSNFAGFPLAPKLTFLYGSVSRNDPDQQGFGHRWDDEVTFLTFPVENLHQDVPVGQHVRSGNSLAPDVCLQTMGRSPLCHIQGHSVLPLSWRVRRIKAASLPGCRTVRYRFKADSARCISPDLVTAVRTHSGRNGRAFRVQSHDKAGMSPFRLALQRSGYKTIPAWYNTLLRNSPSAVNPVSSTYSM